MRLQRQPDGEAILRPEDLDRLRRVLTATLPDGSSSAERDAHAATLIALFKGGITNEIALTETLLGTTDHAAGTGARLP